MKALFKKNFKSIDDASCERREGKFIEKFFLYSYQPTYELTWIVFHRVLSCSRRLNVVHHLFFHNFFLLLFLSCTLLSWTTESIIFGGDFKNFIKFIFLKNNSLLFKLHNQLKFSNYHETI